MRNRSEYLKAYKQLRRKDPAYRAQENANLRALAEKDRLTLIAHYSHGTNQCGMCRCADIRVLCLDHINNNGQEDRQQRGYGYTFFRSIIRSGFPEGLQVLCYNCHAIKTGWHCGYNLR